MLQQPTHSALRSENGMQGPLMEPARTDSTVSWWGVQACG